jgi:hypothetical protein
MNPESPDDAEWKARFAVLRESEAAQAPSFSRTLAAARERGDHRKTFPHPAGSLATLAAVAVVACFLVPALFQSSSSPSLAERLPTLLPPSPDAAPLFSTPLFAEHEFPSDSVLPLNLDFPL